MKFKKGDNVKRIKGTYNGMVVGDTATVKKIPDGGDQYMSLKEFQEEHFIEHFELVKNFTHMIIWDERNKDPFELLCSLKEAKERTLELMSKEEVMKNSIEIYEIKKKLEVKTSISFKEVK